MTLGDDVMVEGAIVGRARLEDVRQACETAASAIAALKPEHWAGWVTYIMEALELETLDGRIGFMAYKAALEAVRDSTDQRINDGRW